MIRLRVLIGDSTSSVRHFIRYTLQDHFKNLDFEVANNGKNVMRRLEGTPYDLIFYDRDMPLLDGEAFLKWLRGHDTLSGTAFIMLSGCRDEESIRRAVALGVSGYLIKPLTQEALVNTVKQVLPHIMSGKGGGRTWGTAGGQDPVTLSFGRGQREVQVESITADGAVIAMEGQEPLPQILEAVSLSPAPDSGMAQSRSGEIVKIEAVDVAGISRQVRCAVTFGSDDGRGSGRSFPDS